eukprot:203543-Chlamydomonas_euryale.AAC.5
MSPPKTNAASVATGRIETDGDGCKSKAMEGMCQRSRTYVTPSTNTSKKHIVKRVRASRLQYRPAGIIPPGCARHSCHRFCRQLALARAVRTQPPAKQPPEQAHICGPAPHSEPSQANRRRLHACQPQACATDRRPQTGWSLWRRVMNSDRPVLILKADSPAVVLNADRAALVLKTDGHLRSPGRPGRPSASVERRCQLIAGCSTAAVPQQRHDRKQHRQQRDEHRGHHDARIDRGAVRLVAAADGLEAPVEGGGDEAEEADVGCAGVCEKHDARSGWLPWVALRVWGVVVLRRQAEQEGLTCVQAGCPQAALRVWGVVLLRPQAEQEGLTC